MVLALSILGAACLGFLALFWLSPLGVPALKRLGGGALSPDLRFGYRPDETYRLLAHYGEKGFAHWRRMLWIDMVFPAVYAALLALLAIEWARWVHPGAIWSAFAVACPVGAALSDYVENALLLHVIAAFPARRDGAVRVASVFTQTKFVLFYATLVIPIVQWIAARVL